MYYATFFSYFAFPDSNAGHLLWCHLLLIMYEALHIMDIKTALIYNTICFWFSHLPLKMCALFMQGWVCAHFLIGTGNRTFWFLSILLLTCIAMEISWN